MTTSNQTPENWLKTRRPARLAISVAMSAPIAGMVIALVLALTVFRTTPPAEGAGAAGFIEVISGAGMVMATGFMLGGVIGWPVMLAFGLPAHALLLRKTSAAIGWYALTGAVIGAAAGGIRLLQTLSGVRPDAYLLHFGIGAVTGAMAAIVFWWLRRPDKDAAERKP
jgi:hypothetical protein